MSEKSLQEIDLAALRRRTFFPSPAAWEDQVLYFLLLDRFSDGNETGYRNERNELVTGGGTPAFTATDRGNATRTPELRQAWFEAGGRFVGGTLAGLESKLGYLRRLGVTALWISPVFKQVATQQSYHGYGIQNFLDVDPRFGTREDLRRLVAAAHRQGIYILLDIIVNHTGDVFDYDPDRYWTEENGRRFLDPRWDGAPYRVRGYRDAAGAPTLPFGPVDPGRHPQAWPEGAVWPVELQPAQTFTAKGRIDNWDHDPEYLEGDFYSLKNIQLGTGATDVFQPSPALKALAQVYQFWLAYADLDGYRLDTVKHMEIGATRYFASMIHEYAQACGKENFYLIGEITGGRERAVHTLEETGLDAALGIDDVQDKLEYLVKGYRDPEDFFSLFRNSLLVSKDSHVWFRNKVVCSFDDHDQVRKGGAKARFAFPEAPGQESGKLLFNALALLVTSLGIPCLYYGTEQGFDGHGNNDRYLREAMFGGAFGAFESRGRHFFNEDTPHYRALAQLLALRRERAPLRRGRQYLRPISGDGVHFGLPRTSGGELRSLVPWSRLFADEELLCALNTDPHRAQTAWVTVDDGLHRAGGTLRCVFSTELGQVGATVAVEARNGKAVQLSVPAAGFVIYG